MIHEASQQTLDLGFGQTPGLRGFRLERLELYNWGTFDGKVWHYELGGKNSLLTGDIGSGKSTIVDAVTTLLVPAHRVQYNRAAGADKMERSLRSYFLGYYKATRGEVGPQTRPVAHRTHNSYSVVLGTFFNRDYGQKVTLAQVFWMKEATGQPARFYVVADQELSVAGDFCDFGGEMKVLRKRLRQAGAELFDSFPPYSAAFRRRFGLANDQALELFHQTVSMKAVGNLTSFVREHMLEEFDVEPRIQALIGHYEDLNRAHEAVLKARAQVEALTPLVADCRRHAELLLQVAESRACRDSLRIYFMTLKASLLERRLELLAADEERLQNRLASARQSQQEGETERGELRQAIAANGGDRLQRLEVEIKHKTEMRQRRQHKHQRYLERVKSLGWSEPVEAEQFLEQRRRGARLLVEQAEQEAELENQRTELLVEGRKLQDTHHELQQELASLRARRSNIHQHQVEIRSRLCAQLGLPESELAFVGELLQVQDKERDWEGAIERLLHNFALSLLVPDRHYRRVAEWVDQTRLRGRLVYFRVLPEVGPPPPAQATNSLVYKVDIKPDTPHYGWLDRQLKRRFDFACCASLEDFRREVKAITPSGQIKAKGERHEKDDRHALDDRSRYVLGWTNEAKIRVLEQRQAALAAEMASMAMRLETQKKTLAQLREQQIVLKQLEEYRDFQEIDWRPLVKEIADLEEEKRALESASDVLVELTARLHEVEARLRQLDGELEAQVKELGAVQQKQLVARELFEEATAVPPTEDERQRFPVLEKIRHEALEQHQLTVESCANREHDVREWLTRQIDNEDKKIERCRERILKAMGKFCNDYPLDTQEMDVNVAAGAEFAELLERLHRDDLPRFEERFKQLLNENTIREIANFQSQLNRERESIRERVEQINGSLRQIDYNPGRYIVLELQRTIDAEIRDFQSELRACTEGALTGSDDEQYSEQKFLKVREIIERFRGREGQAELDRRWTRKVTDVRQWFTFSASERWKADDTEHEHYADSGGKSGGQKEKLAYTVLAASLSYQFGLEAGATRSRTFHFVVIDEAFSRSSDESTRFGLELFQTLDLQLMIVTPLQKIHIIEPYVASVGFCHNDGETFKSAIQNLTIEEYRRRKDAALS